MSVCHSSSIGYLKIVLTPEHHLTPPAGDQAMEWDFWLNRFYILMFFEVIVAMERINSRLENPMPVISPFSFEITLVGRMELRVHCRGRIRFYFLWIMTSHGPVGPSMVGECSLYYYVHRLLSESLLWRLLLTAGWREKAGGCWCLGSVLKVCHGMHWKSGSALRFEAPLDEGSKTPESEIPLIEISYEALWCYVFPSINFFSEIVIKISYKNCLPES